MSLLIFACDFWVNCVILSDFRIFRCLPIRKIQLIKTHKKQDKSSTSFIFKFPSDWGAISFRVFQMSAIPCVFGQLPAESLILTCSFSRWDSLLWLMNFNLCHICIRSILSVKIYFHNPKIKMQILRTIHIGKCMSDVVRTDTYISNCLSKV